MGQSPPRHWQSSRDTVSAMSLLRPELCPKIPAQEQIDRLRELLDRICEVSPDAPERSELVQDFNQLAGRSYSTGYFDEYWSWTDAEHLVYLAALGDPPVVHNPTRGELVEIAGRAMPTSDAYEPMNAEWYLELLDRLVPHPAVSDLIFHGPEGHAGGWEPTPETVVEMALSYKPTLL